MSKRQFTCLIFLSFFLGCGSRQPASVNSPLQETAESPAIESHAEADDAVRARFQASDDPQSSALAEVREMNSSRHPLPPARFERGSVAPLEFDSKQITITEEGFSIQMPSGAPIPTP